MPQSIKLSLVSAMLLVIIPIVDAGAEPTAEQFDFFEKAIRPLLVEHCFECHQGENAKNRLQLDSLPGILRGGLRGPAIMPGKVDESLLVSAIRHGELLKMPPKHKLSTREIAAFETWIKMGAPWPNSDLSGMLVDEPTNHHPLFTNQQKSFWAFQQPVPPPRPGPSVPAWGTSPIDEFILQRLLAANLTPAPLADKRTLIRRATFDLIGLPPTPGEVNAFVTDQSSHAFAKVINRLLTSPHYGERWGRRWLDVARYADSNGLDENLAYGNAYHYRDYVIASFNKDKPFSQFILEQIAGDLLPPTDKMEKTVERIAATGFLSLGPKMLAEDDPVKMQMDIIDEQVDTIGRAFMGLTLGCARCHDHKFDPIPTADYYSLAGIFKSTKTMEHFNVVAQWQERPMAHPSAIQARDEHQQDITDKLSEIDNVKLAATAAVLKLARQHVGDYLLAAHQFSQQEEQLKTAPVKGNQLGKKLPDDMILIEAEDFAQGNVDRDFTTYGKSIGVLVNKGEVPNFAEFDVEITESNLYQLEIRYAAKSPRPCALTINGKLVRNNAAGIVTGGWFPNTQQWIVQGFFKLAAGTNIIRLEHPQFFPHIDKLLIAPAPRNLRELASLESLSDYDPLPSLVHQWVAFLAKERSNEQSAFAAWHALVDGVNLLTHPSPSVTTLFEETTLPTLREMAIRYEQLCVFTPSAQEQEQLPTPVDTGQLGETLQKVLKDPEGPFRVPKTIEVHFPTETASKLKRLRKEKEQLDSLLPTLPAAMSVTEGEIQDIRIHIRGSHLTQADVVPRRFPRILAGHQQEPINDQQSGRLQLANWLVSSKHPLTARVMVNRIWQGHFGEGLVRSPDNFGRLGQRPTHPELLDWLTLKFRESGWSIKTMHRVMMLSSTYQMSTAWNKAAAESDPENRLLWRMNRRRLDAEAIRDSVLALGDSLDLSMGGSLLPTENRKYVTGTANIDPVAYKPKRRSVYMPIVRSALYDVFQAFDFADPSMLTGKRQSTTVAPQALFMMNSQIVSEQMRNMAMHLLRNNSLDDRARIRQAYIRAYAREPHNNEVLKCLTYLDQYTQAIASRQVENSARLQAWQSLCRAIIASNEFVYIE